MRILLVAEESAGMRCLKELAKTEHQIVGVMASPDRATDKGPSVWRTAQAMGLRHWPVEHVRRSTFTPTMAAENLDVILNVHSRYVIRESVLACTRLGAFNLHPGPLPRYAGLNAPSWAIYNGEKRHGVTLHKMAAGIDTGAIVFEIPFDIAEEDTGLTVMTKCIKMGIPLIGRLLETLDRDPASLPLIAQDLSHRRYYGREVPKNGRLCWARPAEWINRLVRASDYYPFASPWGHPIARLNGCDIGIVKARPTGRAAEGPPGTVTSIDPDGVTIACRDEAISVGVVRFEAEVVAAAEVFQVGQRLHDG
jgi:methionyl-tRNA formyltransferase